MKKEFYEVYHQKWFTYHFYEEHLFLKRIFVHTSNFFSASLTLISVAGFLIATNSNVLWAILMLISELIKAFTDEMEYSKQVWSLELYLPKSRLVLLKMAKQWRSIQSIEVDYKDVSFNDENVLDDLYSEYIGGFTFSNNKWITEKAEMKTKAWLNSRNGIEVI